MQQKDSSMREDIQASENGTNDFQTIFPFKNPALELVRDDDPTITTTPSTTLRQSRNVEEISNERNATNASSRHGRFTIKTEGRRASLMELLVEEPTEKKSCFNFFSHDAGFHLAVLFLPSFISMWYSAAVLFPPDCREKAWLFLWDNGVLSSDDEGRPIICPRASICSEGVIQVILIALARLSAFASYGIMSVTFVSKMQSTIHFLSSSYLRTFIPFEDLHHVHVNTGKWYGILAFLHMITHYIRYIVRQDANQLWTTVHLSGLLGIFGMIITIFSMTYLKKFKTKISYEVRFKLHWVGFFTLALALLFHTRRSRTIVLIFGGLWALDYMYGVVCKTHNLEVVEFTPLPSGSGVQMLWRNPEGFRVRSGEYVKVQLPWLPKDGNEWHPFSVYLKEKTQIGLDSLQMPDPTILNEISNVATDNTHLELFVDKVLKSEFRANLNTSTIVEEAREDLGDRYKTTQVFICAVGDWSKSLVNSISNEKRASWVRGPFTSPYHVAQDFSHLVLVASGIGITPALGVMGQYPGFSRTKILMWSTRDLDMFKFFAPLLNDAHLAIIFYTGKTKLSASDIAEFDVYGNIYIQIGRPKKPNGFDAIISCVIVKLENIFDPFGGAKRRLEDLELLRRQAWCVLYCGGAKPVVEELTEFTTKHQIGWEFEQFDW